MIQLDKHMAIRPMGRMATAALKCLLHISKHCSPSYEHQPVLGAAAECGQGLNHGLGTMNLQDNGAVGTYHIWVGLQFWTCHAGGGALLQPRQLESTSGVTRQH